MLDTLSNYYSASKILNELDKKIKNENLSFEERAEAIKETDKITGYETEYSDSAEEIVKKYFEDIEKEIIEAPCPGGIE